MLNKVRFIMGVLSLIPLWRPRSRWEDNTGMDLKEIGINTWNWVDSAKDWDYWRALVNTASNLRVPQVMELVN